MNLFFMKNFFNNSLHVPGYVVDSKIIKGDFFLMFFIISLVALIIILDTFKLQLYNLFPDLEFFLFSLYETLKDVGLFLKDLIK